MRSLVRRIGGLTHHGQNGALARIVQGGAAKYHEKNAEQKKLFARERIFVNDPDSAATAGVAEGLFGAAYRPAGRIWQALFRIDHLDRSGSPTTAGGVVPGGVPTEPTSAGESAVRPG